MHEKTVIDLVERLRDYRTRRLVDPEGMMEEAADEIERLRADLAEQHKEWEAHSAVLAQQRDDNLREIEQLRLKFLDEIEVIINAALEDDDD